jgi:hypothetical protein
LHLSPDDDVDLTDYLSETKNWERSPKVQNPYQFLEEKWYYKPKDAPEIPKGPIPMFEDEL